MKELQKFLFGLVVTGLGALAATLVPNTFQPGTPIKAADVNANFSALNAAITGLQTSAGQLADGSVTAGKLAASPAPTKGQVLAFNGTGLTWATPSAGTAFTAGAGLSLSGTTFSVANAGITTAMLTDGSVTTTKLADSNVTTTKLADNAVTGQKVQNASLPSSKLTDGPGIAAQLTLNKIFFLTSADTVYNTVTLNAPGPGFIVLEASGTTTFPNNDADVALISISKTGIGDPNYSTEVSVSPAPAVSLIIPFALHRVEQVTAAGSYSFNLVSRDTANTGLTQIQSPRLIAMYFPTAYGAIGTN